MAFKKKPEDQKRVVNFGLMLTRREHFILRCIASQLDTNLSDALRHLIEEENERHHYDLIEPESMRPRNRKGK